LALPELLVVTVATVTQVDPFNQRMRTVSFWAWPRNETLTNWFRETGFSMTLIRGAKSNEALRATPPDLNVIF
jgi:hypothetical protein